MTFTAGWNMPGYLPESEPAEFATFEEALQYLVTEVERFWDEDYEAAGEPTMMAPPSPEEDAIRQARSKADARWLPVHTALHNAGGLDTTFAATCGDDHLTFWITTGEQS